MLVRLHCSPGARENRVVVVRNGEIQVKVAAPAVEGQANAALLRYLSQRLGLRISDLRLVRGAGSRYKVVDVEGLSRGEILVRLGLPVD